MLLRRLVAALGPLLLSVLVCAAFRWMDGMIGAASFLAFLLKGALLGAALALTLPLAKGLEFDHVIIPDAGASLFPANDHVAQNRHYPTIRRATRTITILSNGPLPPLLDITHQD